MSVTRKIKTAKPVLGALYCEGPLRRVSMKGQAQARAKAYRPTTQTKGLQGPRKIEPDMTIELTVTLTVTDGPSKLERFCVQYLRP